MNTDIIFKRRIRVYPCLSVVDVKTPSVWISALLGLLFVAAGLWLLFT